MAQVVPDNVAQFFINHEFVALDAVEASDHISVELPGGSLARTFGIQVVTTGGPATATLDIEGSLDGTNWDFDLDAARDVSSDVSFWVVDKPVRFIRANLTALSGGSSPTVTVRVIAIP